MDFIQKKSPTIEKFMQWNDLQAEINKTFMKFHEVRGIWNKTMWFICQ